MNGTALQYFDLHVHTEYSIDAQGKQIQFIDAAIRLRMPGIGFSEHWDFDPNDPSTGRFDYRRQRESLMALLNLCEGEATIFFGAEISYQKMWENEIRQALQGKNFDYIIGAMHHINDIPIESAPDVFKGDSPDDYYVPYFREYLQMIESGLFDIAGHLDYPKKYGNELFDEFRHDDFKDHIDPILEAIINNGMVIEINTAGWRSKIMEQYPSADILHRYKKLGGKYITLGSDAHNPAEVGADFDRAADLVNEIGLQQVIYASRGLYPIG